MRLVDFWLNPICNNGCVQIQRQKNSFQKFRDEGVKVNVEHCPKFYLEPLKQKYSL